MALSENDEAIDTDLAEKRIAEAITDRLKLAVESAGGAAAVSRRSGVPFGSLTKYLAGRQMRPATLVMLSKATGRSVQWLATGSEAASNRESGPAPDPAPSSHDTRTLFSQINADRLGEAYEMARKALAAHGHRNPEPRRLVQVMVLIYDELNSPAESSPSNDPQDSQAAIHEGS